ncbi:hypothetical protein TNCV_887131 [Trichonephila clavipes]|uniref:Uncharacterized protein n=1 Tax=Trichonephila clavipes TaxID=2585209 RepID=A0A8X6RGH9_TRICX|nr:hypothetical protein TNCV_887131 [Trichonephila clavipes]
MLWHYILGVLQVSAVSGFLPDDRHTASLVGLRGGWRHARTKLCYAPMDPSQLCPDKGLVLPNNNIDDIAFHTRFLLICLPNSNMSKLSPFAIHKALTGIGGEPKDQVLLVRLHNLSNY